MSLFKKLSATLACLATIGVSTPQVDAHNPAKYTGIPFVVAGSCPQLGPPPPTSSNFVTVNKQLQLRSFINDFGYSGFEVYASSPSSGSLPTTASGTIPEGILTFNVSGLPSTGSYNYFVQYSEGSPAESGLITPVNGVCTVPANAPTIPGSSVIAVQVYLYTVLSSGTTATVTSSNFRYNNTPLNVDTTVTDQSEAGTTGINPTNYCNFSNQ